MSEDAIVRFVAVAGPLCAMAAIPMVVVLCLRITFHEGRIYECRRGFSTVEDAPGVWERCKADLGGSMFR